jgi:hypothetical protein
MGVSVAKTNTPVSAYITCSKVKKCIASMTKEEFKSLKEFVPLRTIHKGYEANIYLLQQKAEVLSNDILLYCLEVYERDGIRELVRTLRTNEPKLRKLVASSRMKAVQTYRSLEDNNMKEIPAMLWLAS